MNDQALIQSLCDDLVPIRATNIDDQLRTAVAIGGLVSLLGVVMTLGIQPGFETAAVTAPFIMKLGFAAILAGPALSAISALTRPGRRPLSLAMPIGIAIAALSEVTLFQWTGSPEIPIAEFLLGKSANSCALFIAAFALPLMVSLGFVVRSQAPVHLRQAGATIGLSSGAISAAIYALACSETSAGFVMIWYSLGIASVTALGSALGPRLLRW